MSPRARTRVVLILLALALFGADKGRACAQPPLPPGARLRLGSLDLRQNSTVTSIGFMAGGKTLVSCGQGRDDAVLWDLNSGKELRRYGRGGLLAVSPDGKWLALREGSFHLRVVEVVSGQERCMCGPTAGGTCAAAFSSDGAMVFVGAWERKVHVFQTDTGKEVRRFQPRAAGSVEGLWLSADDKTCFTLSDSSPSTLQTWDAATGKPRRSLKGPIQAAAVTPDGKTAVVARDEEVTVWDPATGQVRQLLRGDAAHAAGLAVAPDGRTLALIGFNALRVYDLAETKTTLRWSIPTKATLRWSVPGPANALAFSPDGRTLAVGWGHAVRLWDCHTGKERLDGGHRAGVCALRFLPGGKHLISFADDHTVRAWDLAAGKETRRWDVQESDPSTVRLVAFPDGKTVAFGCYADRLRILDVTSGKERLCEHTPQGTVPAALSADGKHLLTANPFKADRTCPCTWWELSQVRNVREFTHAPVPAEGAEIVAVACSPDGKLFASLAVHFFYGRYGRIPIAHSLSLWDMATGKERRVADVRPTPAEAYLSRETWGLAFRDGGKALVSVVRDGLVQSWDTATLKERRRLRLPVGSVLAFAPDGRFVAGTDHDDSGAVYVWRTDTGREVQRFRGHRSYVTALAFSPDGRTLASGSADTTILVWEVLGLR